MSIFYINIGIKHFTDPYWFLNIIPPSLNAYGLELVYISGFFEILFGIMLFFTKTRKIAAYGLILLLLAVYPANIYLAFNQKASRAYKYIFIYGFLGKVTTSICIFRIGLLAFKKN